MRALAATGMPTILTRMAPALAFEVVEGSTREKAPRVFI